MDNAKQYSQCIPFKRPPRDYGLIADEADNTSFEILPLFEKTANDNMEMFLHSFTTNKLLSCRWQAYKDQYSTREYKPFQFPDLRDYHFFKYHTRLLPTESLKNRSDYRMKLQLGPGVDFRGQMPIPNELHMKRGTRVPKITKNVKVPKSQKT